MPRSNYYTYAYIREDGTPYYIGKGANNRIKQKHGRPCQKPSDPNRIIKLKQNLTEEEAFRHEIYMIALYGRRDNGTGILHNKTDGGDGVSGLIHSDESRAKMSESARARGFNGRGWGHGQDPTIYEGPDWSKYTWYTNGKDNIRRKTHPGEGWWEGRVYVQKCELLTKEQVIEVRRLLADKVKGRTIAKQFNVSEAIISAIKRGVKYRHYK